MSTKYSQYISSLEKKQQSQTSKPSYYGKVIDAWAEPPSLFFLENLPEAEHLFRKSGTYDLWSEVLPILETSSPRKMIPPKDLLKMMDLSGIDKICLCAWARPGKWLVTNEEIAEFVRYDPLRFIGVGTVMLDKPYEAVQEIDKCVKQYGFKAIRVLPWLWNLPPNNKLYYPLYVKCIELDIPFCTQVGHTGPRMPSKPGRPLYIDEVALTFPKLKIICGHIGYPWVDEMIAVAWKHDNVYIDTSAYLPRYYPMQLVHYMTTYGKDKVMFGTNFPQLLLDKCVAQIADLGLDDESMENFAFKNLKRVMKLEDGPKDIKPKL